MQEYNPSSFLSKRFFPVQSKLCRNPHTIHKQKLVRYRPNTVTVDKHADVYYA